METVRFAIDGMTCGHCVAGVRRALAGLDGVETDAVAVGHADVRFDSARVDASTIVQAIADAGYPARVVERVT